MAYSHAFNFVEVNNTFYQIPHIREVQRWRKLVPRNFHFAVRAHRTITHTHRLQPTGEALETLEKMMEICAVLNADVLHMLAPPLFEPTKDAVAGIGNLLASASLGRTRVALEIRGINAKELPPQLAKIMQNRGVIHSVDLSKGEKPAYESDMLYSRLFGKGMHNIYQPTDDELAEIDSKATASGAENITMSFHFMHMYKDAARLKVYKQTGKFPQITDSTALSSLEEVLREDAYFPSTRQQLINNQGWKLFDQTVAERAHAADLLQKLPEKTYTSVGDVIATLQSVMR